MNTRARAVAHGTGAALCGLVSGYAALTVAELVSVAVRPGAGPVTAVGGAVVDRTPSAVKDWAIRQFGTQDKLVLQLGIVAVLAVFAAAMGLLARRHRRSAAAGVLVFGPVGAAAALSRPDSTGPLDALPSLAGALVGAAALYFLAGHLSYLVAADTGGADAAAGPQANDADALQADDADAPQADAADALQADAADALQADAADAPQADAADAPQADAADEATAAEWPPRRRFVLATAGVAVVATGVGFGARRLAANSSARAEAARSAVRLPAPASPAPPLPRGVDLRLPGVAPFTTSNRDFYRVDTALDVPRIDTGGWRLRLYGKGVDTPRVLSFQELLGRDLIERDITMTCVSNEVGGPYVSSARWLGVPLRELLEEAGVRPPSRGGPADQLVARSVDGMTIGTPVEAVMDGRDAMLAVGMNGRPLPFEHGFPLRMLVPGLYGYVSACKWIEDIELTTFDAYDAYWVRRDWAREAPVKTQSRIDTPKPFARPQAGRVTVAGIAWAQRRGIDRVEVRVDDGPWQQAELAAEGSVDTWRQWRWDWPATPGSHTLQVRATDGTGVPQTGERARTIPDGASGWHSVVVVVT